MNMQQTARLILGLRAAGWSDEKNNNFMLYMRSGGEQYKPGSDQPKEKAAE